MFRHSLAGKCIFHIIEEFGPGTMAIGGAGIVLRSIAWESMRRGACPIVIVDSYKKNAPYLKNWVRDGINVYQFPMLKSIPTKARRFGKTRFRQFIAKTRFNKVLELIRPELVHVHLYNGVLRFAYELKRKLNIKVVVTAHGLYPHLLQKEVYKQVKYTPSWRESVEAVDAWVPVGPLVRDKLLRWGIHEEKMISNYNGVYVPKIIHPFKNEIELKRQVNIVYAGRIIEKKGVFDLADAMVELTKLLPNIRPYLQIVGGYTYEMKNALQSRLNVTDKKLEYKLFGEETSERVREIVSSADIFCHPSKNPNEGIGLAVLEAGAYGCPMVLSDHPAYYLSVYEPEVHALFHKTEDAKGLALAIARLVSDSDLRFKLRENAYKLVKEKYSIKRMLNEYMALYERLLR